MPRRRSIQGWPVRASMCPSCPFREGGDRDLASRVLDRTLFQASQICHHPRLHGEKEHELCRGQRQQQLVLLARLGWIDAPTDAAYERKQIELGVRGKP